MSILRRMFNRKENNVNSVNSGAQLNNNHYHYYNHRHSATTKKSSATSKQSTFSNDCNSVRNASATMLPHSAQKLHQQQRRTTAVNSVAIEDDKRSLSVLQLTPLWEHVIRTRTLPENLNPYKMFDEFLERLRDPEWQVRQHALRVLVDVLLVIGKKADTYLNPLIPQLVENLGNPAPTVRKGALDCLRIYLSESAMPESVLLEILDIGLNQRITNEPFGGRLTCGVMLSLPSLVHATLHTPKRNFILQSTIDMLVAKMNQITHQEITLKVLLKLREMLDVREFSNLMTPNNYREFELLCNVYGIGDNKEKRSTLDSKTWQVMASFDSDETFSMTTSEACWRSSDEEEKIIDLPTNCGLKITANQLQPHYEFEDGHEKVIMETEIKINDDTLTMRILEAKDDSNNSDENCSSSDEDKNNNDVFVHEIYSPHHQPIHHNEITTVQENSGFIQVLTDSEVEENNENLGKSLDLNTPRTPKRVTFGGEIVKMRTPDSDTVPQSDVDFDLSSFNQRKNDESTEKNDETKFNFLTVDIPNDCTKPISFAQSQMSLRPKSAQIPKKQQHNLKSSPLSSSEPSQSPSASPLRRKLSLEDIRQKSASPKSHFKRISISPVDDIVSPRPTHKEIEVLHNLQREISPIRPKRLQPQMVENRQSDSEILLTTQNAIKENYNNVNTVAAFKSWEELGIVQPEVLKDLKSGDWRYRSHAICSIEEALKSSDNLAKVQPNLDSLLRTLMSSEKNADVNEDKIRVIINLISRLPLDNLENRTVQIMTGLCRQGGSSANRVSKALMQRLPPAVIVLKLLSEDFLHARSSRFRENSLQIVMYALMTFPSTYFDTSTCVTRATYAALDTKKRVRQAALDVLAILGQVITPKTVLDIVENITNNENNNSAITNRKFHDLPIAVKARLSRKQLPNIRPDGNVQYALRIPSPQPNDPNSSLAHLGADIEWIAAGIGSVSPTSIKRRSQIYHQSNSNSNNNNGSGAVNHNVYGEINWTKHDQRKRCIKQPHGGLCYGVGDNGIYDSDENRTVQYHLQNGVPLQISSMKYHQDGGGKGEQKIGANDKRIATTYTKFISKSSCSDSSYDGRSSDSMQHNQNEGRSQARHSITSRFPAMERMNVAGMSIDRQSYRNPYEIVLSNGNRLNVTYPRQTYSVYKKDSRNLNYQKDMNFESQPHTINHPSSHNGIGVGGGHKNSKRFLNVEKFIKQSNKQQQKIYSPDYHLQIQNNYELQHQNYNNNYHQINEGIKVDEKQENSKTPLSSRHENRFILSPSSNNASPQNQTHPIIKSLTNQPQINKEIHDRTIRNIDQEESNEMPLSVEKPSSPNHSTSNPEIADVVNKSAASTRSQSQHSTERSSSNLEIENNVSRSPSLNSKKSIEIQEEIPFVEKKIDEINLQTESAVNELQTEDVTDNDSLRTNDMDQESIETVILSNAKNETENNVVEVVEKNEQYLKSNSISEKLITTNESKSLSVTPSISPIPTIEVKPMARQSSALAKSYDSIYEPSTTILRQDIDIRSTASTGSSSDYQPSVAASLEFPSNNKNTSFTTLKPQHVPLMRKSKTTLFGSRNRRVSPIKQSMKINKAELFPPTLVKFDKPKDGMNLAVEQLESSNWETVMTGIVSMVRLMRFHPDILDNNIHLACMQLAKTVKNLRSQVARAACQASKEFFSERNKLLEQECDELVGNLLNRTADTNRFIRADATLALESMCDNLQPPKVIYLLTTRGAQHLNAVVRTATAKLLNRLVERLGCGVVFGMNRDNREKIFVTSANLLLEGSLETRNYAKALFRILCDHPNYKRSLLEFVPTRTYRNIEKTLKTIVGRVAE